MSARTSIQEALNSSTSGMYLASHPAARYSLFMNISDVTKVSGSTRNDVKGRLTGEENRNGFLWSFCWFNSDKRFTLCARHFCFKHSHTFSSSNFIVCSHVDDIVRSMQNPRICICGCHRLDYYHSSPYQGRRAAVPFKLTTLERKSVVLKTGNARYQLVEMWITDCSKGLFSYSFQLGVTFVSVGIWSIAVGFLTEYIAWRFVMEKKDKDQHRPLHRTDLEDEVSRVLDRYAGSQGTGTVFLTKVDIKSTLPSYLQKP